MDSFISPVISNVTALPYESKDEAISLLAQQLTKPVLYKQSIQANMDKVDYLIEFGNGAVLKGLNRKGVSAKTICVNSMASLEEVLELIND